MLRRAPLWLAALLFAIVALAPAAYAATFDVIWADRIDVVTFSDNVGFTLAGTDIALVVNKGPADIDAAEFFGTTFTATSSNPAVIPHPFINNPGLAITPIHPDEALGSVTSLNGVLTSKLLPGETLHNTTPEQVLSLQVTYPPGFVGTATFDVTMTIGLEIAQYTILANFTHGPDFAIAFPSAARVSSSPVPVAAKPVTWGTIKKLYR